MIRALTGLLLISLATPAAVAGETGAGYRVTATLLTRTPHAVVEDTAGVQRRVHAGAMLGACFIESIEIRSIVLQCPEGERELRLLGARYRPGSDATSNAVVPRRVFNEFFANRQSFFDSLTVKPEVDGAELAGYRVEFLDYTSPLALLPLETGDLIVALNGVPARDGKNFMTAIRNVPDTGRLDVAVQRGGANHTIHLSLVD